MNQFSLRRGIKVFHAHLYCADEAGIKMAKQIAE